MCSFEWISLVHVLYYCQYLQHVTYEVIIIKTLADNGTNRQKKRLPKLMQGTIVIKNGKWANLDRDGCSCSCFRSLICESWS